MKENIQAIRTVFQNLIGTASDNDAMTLAAISRITFGLGVKKFYPSVIRFQGMYTYD